MGAIMKLLNIELCNTGSYKDTHSFDLDGLGMVLVKGKNGCGKSTLFDKIVECIFGKSIKGVRVDDVKNWYASKKTRCYTRLKFVAQDCKEYLITRYRYDSEFGDELHFHNLTDDKNLTLATINETQKIIQRTIDIDFDTFTNAVYIPQNSFAKLLFGTDSEIKEMFVKLFRLEKIDAIYDLAAADFTPLNTHFKSIEIELNGIRNQVDSIIKLSIRDDEKCETFSELKGMIDKLTNEKHQLSEALLSAKEEESRISEEIKRYNLLVDESDEYDIRISSLKDKVESNEFKIENLKGARKNRADKIEKLKARMKNMKDELKELKCNENIDKLVVKRKKQRNDLNGKIKVVYGEKTEYHTKSSFHVNKLEENKLKIEEWEKAEGNNVCPLCLQEITVDHVKKMIQMLQDDNRKITEEIAVLGKSIEKNKIILEELNNELKIVDNELDELAEEKSKNDVILEKIENIENSIAIIKDEIHDNDFDNINTNDEIRKLTDNNKKFSSELNEIKIKIENIESELDSFNSDELENDMEDVKREINDVNNKITATNDNLNNKEKCVEEIKRLQKDEKKMKNELTELEVELNILSDIKKICGRKGYKTHKISTMVSVLNMMLAKYFNEFDYDDIETAKFVVDFEKENIGFFVKYSGLDELKSIKAFSGGEKQRIFISVIFALTKLLADTNMCNILILDEPFGGLDSDGRNAAIEIIKEFKKQQSIFFSTHIEEIHSEGFEQVWNIYKEGNTSKVQIECV